MTEQDFVSMIDDAARILNEERTAGRISGGKITGSLVELQVPRKLAIISDIHGDLDSLLTILDKIDYENFLSDPANKMIFLGDYVDRGSRSIEVLYAVCMLKTKFKDSVVLMRGNHEAYSEFAFPSHDLPYKIAERFAVNGAKIYVKTLALFKLFSLATLVENSLFLVHGGPPTLQDISDFRRKIANGQEEYLIERTFEEILWNDPRQEILDNSDWEPSRRGIGRHFGRNVSRKWLDATGSKAIVRGHEPCAGYRLDHEYMVLTLFSCKEAYPKFAAAYITISENEIRQLKNAKGLVDFVIKI
jgi:diadenosine tetraphosphatase ApaH/serine/threonine PP2A family protein phosphatase